MFCNAIHSPVLPDSHILGGGKGEVEEFFVFLFGRRTLDILFLWGKLAPCCFARIKGLASSTIEETSQELPFSLNS